MEHDPGVMLARSRELRKHMTREECHLYYDGLKPMPWKFRRQVVLGDYIVDFCCVKQKVVVEVDGTQQFLEQGTEYDARRDARLKAHGYLVLRYSNADVNTRFEAVCEDIFNQCRDREEKR